MKIGIMTFWWSNDNYGQLLQCYALQKYLRDAGHDAYLIRYDPRNDYVKSSLWQKALKASNPVKLFSFFYHKIKKAVVYARIEKANTLRRFKDFRCKYIEQSEKIYYSYKDLAEAPPEADVYIVGSDQVWNFYGGHLETIRPQVKAYFLDFGAIRIKRMAYAASFGKAILKDNFIQEITPLLGNFDYVSVREKSGLDICRQCGFDTAEWVPDPTMLLKAADYRSLYHNEPLSNIEKSYCLLYMLSNTYDFSTKVIYDWAKRKALKIVYITGNSQYDKYEKIYATICEWLYLIDNAEYIITNSFHCSIFSLLFRKRFGVIPLTGGYIGMNSRFDSLFEIFKINNRFIDSSFVVLDTDIDWNKVGDTFKHIQNSCNLLAYI
jgi:hypothetical protein